MTTPINIIQAVGSDNGFGTVSKNVTIAATQAGSVLVAVSTLNSGQFTVSDGTNTYNLGTALATFGPASYLVYNCAAGITTVTFSTPGSNSACFMVLEIGAALNTSGVLDQGLGAQVAGTAWNTGNMTATNFANDMILTFIFKSGSNPTWGSTGGSVPVTGTGIVSGAHDNPSAGHSLYAQYRIVAAKAAYAGTGTTVSGGTLNSITFALEQAVAGPAMVQATALLSGTTAAITGTLNGCTAGNTLIFLGCSQTSGAGSPVTVDNNGTILQAVLNNGANGTGTNQQSGIWYEDNIVSGTHQVTMTPASTIRPIKGILMEWSGFNSAGSFDKSANASGGAVQTLSTGATSATTSDLEVAFAVIGTSSSSGVANIAITDPPTGFNSIAVGNNTTSSATGCEMAYAVNVALGATPSASWSWTDANARASSAAIATFAPGGSSPPVTPDNGTLIGLTTSSPGVVGPF